MTRSLRVFETLSYLVGVVTVTPQIQVLLPLAADLAPEKKHAAAISIVLSGLLFGILLARILARILMARWLLFRRQITSSCTRGKLFDASRLPFKKQGFDILELTTAKFSVTEPILIQASLINLASSACFSDFWVTLMFLLGGL